MFQFQLCKHFFCFDEKKECSLFNLDITKNNFEECPPQYMMNWLLQYFQESTVHQFLVSRQKRESFDDYLQKSCRNICAPTSLPWRQLDENIYFEWWQLKKHFILSKSWFVFDSKTWINLFCGSGKKTALTLCLTLLAFQRNVCRVVGKDQSET